MAWQLSKISKNYITRFFGRRIRSGQKENYSPVGKSDILESAVIMIKMKNPNANIFYDTVLRKHFFGNVRILAQVSY